MDFLGMVGQKPKQNLEDRYGQSLMKVDFLQGQDWNMIYQIKMMTLLMMGYMIENFIVK